MVIKVFKTYEVEDDLWQKIVRGFNECFPVAITVEDLKTSFCVQNVLGYGYHAVAFADDGDVMGFNTFSPVFYKHGIKAVVSGSSYVKKQYRKDIFIFSDMCHELADAVRADGYQVCTGVSNQNSFKYALKINHATYIGDLDYYILPFNMSRCLDKKNLACVDWLICFFARFHTMVQMLIAKIFNHKELHSKYELELSDQYFERRFQGSYQTLNKGGIVAYYKMYNENGANTAYVMDFRQNGERTSRALAVTLRHIAKVEHPDAIMFVGWLRLRQMSLFKVPKRFVPKRLPMTISILDKANRASYEDMKEKNNWNFSLMNFDVR